MEFVTQYTLRLLYAWDTAWNKYKGSIGGLGALLGLALVKEAQIMEEEGHNLGKQYWLSPIRSNINLAFQQAEAEGWLTKQIAEPRLYQSFGECFLAVCGEFSSETRWFEDIVEQYNGPDICWWSITLKGKQKFNEIIQLQAAEKYQKGSIGFVKRKE